MTGQPLDHPASQQVKVYRFPQRFLWGASTSSHQVEGGNRWNDWWEHEESGRLPHRSSDACRHYERFEQDFDLARSWGHNAHRFSIEWSRIEPSQGRWNTEALEGDQRIEEAGSRADGDPHHFATLFRGFQPRVP